MAGDALTLRVQCEVVEDEVGQVFGDVIPHLKMWRPRILCGVHIEPRALAQIIGVVIGHTLATRAGVGEDQRDALFRRPSLRACLGHGVFVGAGQARQIPQHGHGAILRFGRLEQAKGHVRTGCLRGMFIDPLGAAETGVFRNRFHGAFLSKDVAPTKSVSVST